MPAAQPSHLCPAVLQVKQSCRCQWGGWWAWLAATGAQSDPAARSCVCSRSGHCSVRRASGRRTTARRPGAEWRPGGSPASWPRPRGGRCSRSACLRWNCGSFSSTDHMHTSMETQFRYEHTACTMVMFKTETLQTEPQLELYSSLLKKKSVLTQH